MVLLFEDLHRPQAPVGFGDGLSAEIRLFVQAGELDVTSPEFVVQRRDVPLSQHLPTDVEGLRWSAQADHVEDLTPFRQQVDGQLPSAEDLCEHRLGGVQPGAALALDNLEPETESAH